MSDINKNGLFKNIAGKIQNKTQQWLQSNDSSTPSDRHPSRGVNVNGGRYAVDNCGKATMHVGSNAMAGSIIHMFFLHMSNRLPDALKVVYCEWAQLPLSPWTDKHQALFGLACSSILKEAQAHGKLPAQFQSLMPYFLELDVELPRPLTHELKSLLQKVILGKTL